MRFQIPVEIPIHSNITTLCFEQNGIAWSRKHSLTCESVNYCVRGRHTSPIYYASYTSHIVMQKLKRRASLISYTCKLYAWISHFLSYTTLTLTSSRYSQIYILISEVYLWARLYHFSEYSLTCAEFPSLVFKRPMRLSPAVSPLSWNISNLREKSDDNMQLSDVTSLLSDGHEYDKINTFAHL